MGIRDQFIERRNFINKYVSHDRKLSPFGVINRDVFLDLTTLKIIRIL